MEIGKLFYRLKQCIQLRAPLEGQKIHAHMLKTGIVSYLPSFCNVLMDLYGRCGYLEDALKLFEEMPGRDLVSWASILTSLNQANLPHRSISIFSSMFSLDRLQPDHFVFASLIKACALISDDGLGRQVHCQFLKSTFSHDDVAKSSLVDMYAKHGLPEKASLVFDTIVSKSTACWTALISGYARSGKKYEAIEMFKKLEKKNLEAWTALISGLVQTGNHADAFQLFAEMRREGVEIADPYVLSSISGAAASLAALGLGEQVHCLILVLGYDSSLFLTNALVDMYAKCSDLSAAKKIFDNMRKKDVVSWTSIIVGMAQHGRGSEALSLYDEMISAGVKPNEVTFIGLVYACSHVGLVERGRALFELMIKDYGMKPSLRHYTCLLDLYSRSGYLFEAEDLLKRMPFQPDEAVWAALLSACTQHRNTKMGVRIANHILSLGPKDPATCILLSNTYAGAGFWKNVSKVRKLMIQMGTKREPGYSYIDLGKESLVFYAGESLEQMKDEIFDLLNELDAEMRKRGYVPDTSFVLLDMNQHEKERQLFWHSERLAVAYGLLKSIPGAVIRIVKNLRVCGDCHTVLKFISSITNREIVVRDLSRFHHFKNGNCSCRDFW
ncbi:OLC1v1018958C1 [Oldenlandia corymbosa var. corymbosa]|uniref:OLC1v1018958C1 n=1 Tax=Oldenlandia corymbosa var. corymbosa TaxID=529605 RepID=A0AAV1ECX7_OLDCO|nr:OLC1v1018958C1 [Oldenlandia corymbosa var. corymbosa]